MAIQVLPPDVVDQIAAGEVVERPSHLVKELVENALDAGATEIEVEFNLGGREVSVRDNGRGISRTDLCKAFARHATSKIECYDDLWKLATYGFRGEALASIGAVSRLTITSRQSGDESAQRMTTHFGTIHDAEKVGGTPGTLVQVEELFANVPARLKFLKSEASESAQIRYVLKALAMSHPDVSFRIKSQGKLLHFWGVVNTRRERVQQVLDVNEMFEVKRSDYDFQVECVFASPNETAKNSRQIWAFAQQRWVQDKTIQAAILEAYRNLLMHGEYPIVAIWLSSNPADVDVNIHPTKSQVKFRNSQNVFRAVESTLRLALEEAPWLKTMLPLKTAEKGAAPLITVPPAENMTFTEANFERTQYLQKSFEPSRVLSELREYSARPELERPRWSDLQILGQAHLTYIVAQTRKGMIFVDQHAAHERVAFERLLTSWRKGNVETQTFLMPLNLDLEEDQAQALLSRRAEFANMGITLEQGGPQTVYVTSGPLVIGDMGLVKGLSQAAHEIVEKAGSFAFEHMVTHIFATMACHSVVRAGQPLSIEQMRELLVQMDEFPLSSFCPHGRPVFVEYDLAQLERDFARTI